jgi:antirestriction protein ArdC
MADSKTAPSFSELLATVVTEPGKLEQAFSRFHNYSIGNQLLALIECFRRGIAPGPIATYAGWQALGRQVRKGEKAIELCMPITCKRTVKDETTGDESPATFTRFAFKPRWFVLSQTDGVDYVAPAPPTWDKARALAALDITEEAFVSMNGNSQGYAVGRRVAISPVAERPFPTLVHELAHVILGHTTNGARLEDGAVISYAAAEVEAECVALLVAGSLGQDGLEYCRGYVQHYLRGAAIDERTAQRIFKAADTILRAGRVDQVEELPVAA